MNVNLVRNHNDYEPPAKRACVAFSGAGRTLADPEPATPAAVSCGGAIERRRHRGFLAGPKREPADDLRAAAPHGRLAASRLLQPLADGR